MYNELTPSITFFRQGSVFALFVPYFCDIPRVAVTHVLGVPVTGKSLTYIIGLQVRKHGSSGSIRINYRKVLFYFIIVIRQKTHTCITRYLVCKK